MNTQLAFSTSGFGAPSRTHNRDGIRAKRIASANRRADHGADATAVLPHQQSLPAISEELAR
jgi:hypothetical protein